MSTDDRLQREEDFWGHHVPTLDESLAQVRQGPDPNTAAMLEAVAPLAGTRVLDFACGAGITTAWLAQQGAEVVGLDLSGAALARAREVLDALGLEAALVQTTLQESDQLGSFDAIVGRYALHHTDVATVGPPLARRLRPGGRAAFVETFATNPVLAFARRRLVDRFGIPRLGTLDERPLDDGDVAALRLAFGSARVTVAEMCFLRLFDRQVLRFRYPTVSGLLGRVDDALNRVPRSERLSYHQVVVLRAADA